MTPVSSVAYLLPTRRRQSPKTLYLKQFHRGIFTDQRGAFNDGLRRKHAIEGVAIFGFEITSFDRVIVRYGEVTESVGGDEFVELSQGAFHAR